MATLNSAIYTIPIMFRAGNGPKRGQGLSA